MSWMLMCAPNVCIEDIVEIRYGNAAVTERNPLKALYKGLINRDGYAKRNHHENMPI